jgi:hypothetical protein
MFGKDNTCAWLGYADNSYIASRLLWFTGFMLETPMHGHRTLELYLKAFLISRGAEVKPGSAAWGHELAALGKAAADFDQAFAANHVQRPLRYFERYFDYVRYPGDHVGPDDGSGTWFAFDANVAPLDGLVALIRPRISLVTDEWIKTVIHRLLHGGDANPHQLRALTDGNRHLAIIDCVVSGKPDVVFTSFRYDRPGC